MSGNAAGPPAPGPSSGTTALSGIGGSLEDKDCELLCPVCFELINEAYVTRCGHSFCFACVSKSVELHRRCPKCGAVLPTNDHIFPNFLLNELVASRRLRAMHPAAPAVGNETTALRSLLANEARHLPLRDVDNMLEQLTRRKRLLEAECAASHHRLLLHFLSQLHTRRTQQLQNLQRETQLVKKDMEHVASVLKGLRGGTETVDEGAGGDMLTSLRSEIAELSAVEGMGDEGESEEGFAGGAGGDALAARWRRLSQHFDDFVQCYFTHRGDELYFPGSSPPEPTPQPPAESLASTYTSVDTDHVPQAPDSRPQTAQGSERPISRGEEDTEVRSAHVHTRGLDAFREDLVAFTRYKALRPLATLSYCSDAINYSTIVSTIEFDKDEELFAIAGVTKRIKARICLDFAEGRNILRPPSISSNHKEKEIFNKYNEVFEWESVVRDAVDVHYPCAEMQCSHKISCVSWNAYHKQVLASSDYEGTVSVWDAGTGQRTRALMEHDKRCWSVHFNRADVRLLASGSDDARVKLWSLNAERSVATLEAKFNVCCVRFNPRSSCHLAFGSADHCVHYYDLRAPRRPLQVLRDHRKAVSYVKFLDSQTIVSASTDSQLKLWRVDSPRCVRSFTGHANEKNFVGLATDGTYVACGSENNSLYVYYAGLSRPLLHYRFDAHRPFLPTAGTGPGGIPGTERRDDEPSEFVSAVCWRRSPHAPALLAANSQGTIKVLELV